MFEKVNPEHPDKLADRIAGALVDMAYAKENDPRIRYRYIHNMTWGQIADKMYTDERTARRWHDKALVHISLPEEPIVI